ncbi:hypothetical protein [Serratia phage SMP]|uniref:Uncharacterized protein n=1 Tax=Serratia phage SMP TaxID=2982904 RepID=A0A9E8G0I1_9CAUD|nr:hypothetical protein [Serratia phage SMP]
MSRAAVIKHNTIKSELVDGIKFYKCSKFFSWKLMVVDVVVIAAALLILH